MILPGWPIKQLKVPRAPLQMASSISIMENRPGQVGRLRVSLDVILSQGLLQCLWTNTGDSHALQSALNEFISVLRPVALRPVVLFCVWSLPVLFRYSSCKQFRTCAGVLCPQLYWAPVPLVPIFHDLGGCADSATDLRPPVSPHLGRLVPPSLRSLL